MSAGGSDLKTAIKGSDASFLDLMEKCLKWDPAARLTPEQVCYMLCVCYVCLLVRVSLCLCLDCVQGAWQEHRLICQKLLVSLHGLGGTKASGT